MNRDLGFGMSAGAVILGVGLYFFFGNHDGANVAWVDYVLMAYFAATAVVCGISAKIYKDIWDLVLCILWVAAVIAHFFIWPYVL